MLCVFLGTGILLTPWWLFVPATVFFLIGTEIRVRVEDQLLGSHFGNAFHNYRHRVRAYIPFLR
jgi:protein-S-isoprenylcysteine O-methyltransferase Ste14